MQIAIVRCNLHIFWWVLEIWQDCSSGGLPKLVKFWKWKWWSMTQTVWEPLLYKNSSKIYKRKEYTKKMGVLKQRLNLKKTFWFPYLNNVLHFHLNYCCCLKLDCWLFTLRNFPNDINIPSPLFVETSVSTDITVCSIYKIISELLLFHLSCLIPFYLAMTNVASMCSVILCLVKRDWFSNTFSWESSYIPIVYLKISLGKNKVCLKFKHYPLIMRLSIWIKQNILKG